MRYPSLNDLKNSATRRGARQGATAAAIPISPSLGGLGPLKIPPPPPGALVAAGGLVAAGAIYNYFTTPQTGKELIPVGGGKYRFRGARTSDLTPDGLFTYTQRSAFNGHTSQWPLPIEIGNNEVEIYADYGGQINENIERWLPSEILGPLPDENVTPKVQWVVIPPAGTQPGEDPTDAEKAPPPLYPGLNTPTEVYVPPQVGTGVKNPPHIVPGINPIDALLSPEGAVSQTPPLSVAAVPVGTPEMKSAGAKQFAGAINRFFGAGGELQDATRCLVFGLGFTYTGRSGQEKAIPKSQWSRTLANYSYFKHHPGDFYNDNFYKKYVKQTERFTPAQQAGRTLKCLAENLLEDATIGTFSNALTQIGTDLGLTVGPFGIESFIAAASGEVPYENLI